ncbi:hypothetical protein BSKO_08914 [Bryopsis sp. KO-2023]|nr:hypothetical protein BSKO_08914 [Bryopsis sp. KO-2023]
MLRSFRNSFFGSRSKSEQKPSDVQEAEGQFTKDEIRDFHASFRSVAGNAFQISYVTFLAWFHLADVEPDLAKGVCRALDRERTQGITYDDLIVALKSVVKGTDSERARFVFRVLDSGGAGVLKPEDIAKGVEECGGRISKDLSGTDGIRDVALAVAAGAMKGERGESFDELGFDEFYSWCTKVPSVVRVLGSLMDSWREVPHPPSLVIPKLAICKEAQGKGTMLDPSWLWLLCGGLPQQYCNEWELLFSSRVHGASYNTLLGAITNKGVTLLIVRDTQGHTFGGLATTPWEKKGNFFGDYSSFLFTVQPTFNVYKSSGVNENFQWCGQGFNELPNGVGFGGQMRYFSLFVDDSFEGGMSRPTVTFGTPCLASAEVFKVKEVECWLVEPVEEDPWDARKSKSVLDRNLEDQRVLELAGKVKYSDGYRAEDPNLES